MSKQRNSNIEMLRVVLMTLIVIWHYIMHGLDMKSPALYQDEQWNNTLAIFSASFMSFPVDCFIFISGYFGITLKKSKVIRFVIMIFTYSLITLMIGLFLGTKVDWFSLLQTCLPISSNRWWFFTSYFYIILLSPFLNAGAVVVSKSSFKSLLVLLFISFYGVGLLVLGHRFIDFNLFIFIYLLGRYFKRFEVNYFVKNSIIIISSCVIVLGTLTYIAVEYQYSFLLYRLWYYHNPLVLALAISVFFLFYNHKGLNVKISWLSSGVFAAYLITDSIFVREAYNQWIIKNIPHSLWLFVALASVGICSIIELFRTKITDQILNKIKL